MLFIERTVVMETSFAPERNCVICSRNRKNTQQYSDSKVCLKRFAIHTHFHTNKPCKLYQSVGLHATVRVYWGFNVYNSSKQTWSTDFPWEFFFVFKSNKLYLVANKSKQLKLDSKLTKPNEKNCTALSFDMGLMRRAKNRLEMEIVQICTVLIVEMSGMGSRNSEKQKEKKWQQLKYNKHCDSIP